MKDQGRIRPKPFPSPIHTNRTLIAILRDLRRIDRRGAVLLRPKIFEAEQAQPFGWLKALS